MGGHANISLQLSFFWACQCISRTAYFYPRWARQLSHEPLSSYMQEQPGKTCPDKSANNTTEPLQAHNYTDGETDVPEVEFECSGNALDQDNLNDQSQGKPVHKKTNISKGQHLYHSILAEAKHIAAFASRDYAMGEKVLAYFESFKMELFQGNIPSLGCVQQGKLTPANLFTL